MSTPYTSGVWMAVCGSEVLVKNKLITDGTFTYGDEYTLPPNMEISALQCTNVVTDQVTSTDQVTVPVNIVQPAPWDGETTYHVILTDPSAITVAYNDKIYHLDSKAEVQTFSGPGEYIITGRKNYSSKTHQVIGSSVILPIHQK